MMADENELERNVLYDLHISAAEKKPGNKRKHGVGDAGRCSKQVSKRDVTPKKRIFHGNQHSKKLDHNKKEVPNSHKEVKGVRKLSF